MRWFILAQCLWLKGAGNKNSAAELLWIIFDGWKRLLWKAKRKWLLLEELAFHSYWMGVWVLQAHTEGDGCWESGAKVGWAVKNQREKMLLKIPKEIRTTAEILAGIDNLRKLTRLLSSYGKFSKHMNFRWIAGKTCEGKSTRCHLQGSGQTHCASELQRTVEFFALVISLLDVGIFSLLWEGIAVSVHGSSAV